MTETRIKVKEASLEEAFKVHKNIPEFLPNPPKTLNEFEDEIQNSDSLILVAYVNNKPVGYVIGHDKFKDGSFYSWLGGVMPQYRKLGVYTILKKYQERVVKKRGYTSIKVKTWNRRIEMRIFLAKSGYNIVGFEEKADVLDNRLMHEKII